MVAPFERPDGSLNADESSPGQHRIAGDDVTVNGETSPLHSTVGVWQQFGIAGFGAQSGEPDEREDEQVVRGLQVGEKDGEHFQEVR